MAKRRDTKPQPEVLAELKAPDGPVFRVLAAPWPEDRLPSGFDWRHYERLAEITDYAPWAYEFAVRSGDLPDDIMVRSPGHEGRDLEPFTSRAKGPHFLWQNGVLCVGRMGRRTHEALEVQVDRAERGVDIAKGVPGDPQYDRFLDVGLARKYQVLELAINICMPEEAVLEEVSRLVREAQARFLEKVPLTKAPGMTGATALQWARGLACWDLMHKHGFTKYRVKKILGPAWSDGEPSANLENEKTQVDRALAAVQPYIHEGKWRELAGDPFATVP